MHPSAQLAIFCFLDPEMKVSYKSRNFQANALDPRDVDPTNSDPIALAPMDLDRVVYTILFRNSSRGTSRLRGLRALRLGGGSLVVPWVLGGHGGHVEGG